MRIEPSVKVWYETAEMAQDDFEIFVFLHKTVKDHVGCRE